MKIICFICLVSVCLVLPLTAWAQIDRDCLKENIMNKDYSQRVTLITFDTTSITGRLLKVDFDRDLLTLEIGSRSQGSIINLTIDSLTTVKFYRRGKIEGEWMLAGFLGGGLLGGGICAAGEKSGLSRNVQYFGGFIAGGLIGLMLGFILPPMFNSQTIECGSALTSEE